LNRVTSYTYDAEENLTAILDAGGRTTSYQYDERDLLFKETDARTPAGVTQWDYTPNGELKKITDAQGNATSYLYDGFDRMTRKTYADGSYHQYSYDKNTNLLSHITPSSKTITFEYDAMNRRTAKRFSVTPSLDTTYSYDPASRLLTANNAASQISYIYDTLNRVTSTTQTIGSLTAKTLTYQYDKTGNRTRVTYPSGKIIDYAYNGNEQVTGMSVDSVSLANYTYDPLNRRTQKDLLSAVTQRASYSYDLANQLQQILNGVVSGPTISQYDYTYNQVGSRLTMATSGAPGAQNFNYTYDNIDQLTAVSGSQSHTYNYDKVHNRTSADGVTYSANNLHQYTTVAGTSYTYDPNGNLTNDGTTTYTYDEQNRLTTATKPGMIASYTYDAFNRRVSKTVNGVATYFIHDQDEDIAEYSSTGPLQSEYVYGPELDEVLTMDRSAQKYYYSHDALGSVTEITDNMGNVVEKYTYDPYGRPTIRNGAGSILTTSSITNPHMFTGRRLDPETNLFYFRNRMYSPVMGRFLQRDPIGYFDSMNLFQYVRNSPLNWIDPFGLKKGDQKYGFPDDFWNWYHHEWKLPGDRDATKEEAQEAYEQWKAEGKPRPRKDDKNKQKDKKEDSSQQINPDAVIGWTLIIAGGAIVVFDIITCPSGEGLIGGELIRQGLGRGMPPMSPAF
jgi:RHS repeat-associated protein